MSFGEVEEEIRRVLEFNTVREAEKLLTNLTHDIADSESTLKNLIKGTEVDLIDLCDKVSIIDSTCDELSTIQEKLENEITVNKVTKLNKQNIENKHNKSTITNEKENLQMSNELNEESLTKNFDRKLMNVEIALQCHKLWEASIELFSLNEEYLQHKKTCSEWYQQGNKVRNEDVNKHYMEHVEELIFIYAEQIEKVIISEVLQSSAEFTCHGLKQWQERLEVTNNVISERKVTQCDNYGDKDYTIKEKRKAIIEEWVKYVYIIQLLYRCKASKVNIYKECKDGNILRNQHNNTTMNELLWEEITEAEHPENYEFVKLRDNLQKYAQRCISDTKSMEMEEQRESHIIVNSFLQVIAKVLLRMIKLFTENVHVKQYEVITAEHNKSVDSTLVTKINATATFAEKVADYFVNLIRLAESTKYTNTNDVIVKLEEEEFNVDQMNLHEELESSSTISALYIVMQMQNIIALSVNAMQRALQNTAQTVLAEINDKRTENLQHIYAALEHHNLRQHEPNVHHAHTWDSDRKMLNDQLEKELWELQKTERSYSIDKQLIDIVSIKEHSIAEWQEELKYFATNFVTSLQTLILNEYAYHPLIVLQLIVQKPEFSREEHKTSLEKSCLQQDKESNSSNNAEQCEYIIHELNVTLQNLLSNRLVEAIQCSFQQTDVLFTTLCNQLEKITSEESLLEEKELLIRSKSHKEQLSLAKDDNVVDNEVAEKSVSTNNNQCINSNINNNFRNAMSKSMSGRWVQARQAWMLSQEGTMPECKMLNQLLCSMGSMPISTNKMQHNEESHDNSSQEVITDKQLAYAMRQHDKLQSKIEELMLWEQYESFMLNEQADVDVNEQEGENDEHENEHHNDDKFKKKHTLIDKLVSVVDAERSSLYTSRWFDVNEFFFMKLNKFEEMEFMEEKNIVILIIQHVQILLNDKNVTTSTVNQKYTCNDIKLSFVVVLMNLFKTLQHMRNILMLASDKQEEYQKELKELELLTSRLKLEMWSKTIDILATFCSKWSASTVRFINIHKSVNQEKQLQQEHHKSKKEGFCNVATLLYISPLISLLMEMGNCISSSKYNRNEKLNTLFTTSEAIGDVKTNILQTNDKKEKTAKPISTTITTVTSEKFKEAMFNLHLSSRLCYNTWIHDVLIKEFSAQFVRLFTETISQLKEFVTRFTRLQTNDILNNNNNNNSNKYKSRKSWYMRAAKNNEDQTEEMLNLVSLFYSDRLQEYNTPETHTQTHNATTINVTDKLMSKSNVDQMNKERNATTKPYVVEGSHQEESLSSEEQSKLNTKAVKQTFHAVYQPTPELLFLLLDLENVIRFITNGRAILNNSSCSNVNGNNDLAELKHDVQEKATKDVGIITAAAATTTNKSNIVHDDDDRNRKLNMLYHHLPSSLHIPVHNEINQSIYQNLQESVAEEMQSHVLPIITETIRELTKQNNESNYENKNTTEKEYSSSPFCYLYQQLYFDLNLTNTIFKQHLNWHETETTTKTTVEERKRSKDVVCYATSHEAANNNKKLELVLTEILHSCTLNSEEESRWIECVAEQEIQTLEEERGLLLLWNEKDNDYKSSQMYDKHSPSMPSSSSTRTNIKNNECKKERIVPICSTTASTSTFTKPREIKRFQLLPLATPSPLQTNYRK